MTRPSDKRDACPAWCAQHHELRPDEDDPHIGGALLVRSTVLRLCASTDRATGTLDGPFVLVGDAEYTLHEAEALGAALTQLIDQGRDHSPRALQREGAVAVDLTASRAGASARRPG